MVKTIEEYMNEWWDKYHKEDIRCSGEFSWDEIKEFGKFLKRKLKKENKK